MTNWDIVLNQAKKSLSLKTHWESPVDGKKYCVIHADDKSIIVDRLSGGRHVTLGKRLIESAIKRLVKTGKLRKTELIPGSVAAETAIIMMHPLVSYNAKEKIVYWMGAVPAPVSGSVRVIVHSQGGVVRYVYANTDLDYVLVDEDDQAEKELAVSDVMTPDVVVHPLALPCIKQNLMDTVDYDNAEDVMEHPWEK